MKLDVMTMWYNEEFLAPFFLNHYKFADRIHIFLDADTNDNTLQKIKESDINDKIIVYSFKFPDMMDDFIKINHFNKFYSELKCDYVALVDSDEFIFLPGNYLNNSNHLVHFTKLWTVYRHSSEKDLDPSLPIKEQRSHGVIDFEGFNVFVKPNIVKCGIDWQWSPGHHTGKLFGSSVSFNRNIPFGVNPDPLIGAHWSMADESYVIKRRINGRKLRQSKTNLKYGLTVQHHHVTEEQIRTELNKHSNDPRVF